MKWERFYAPNLPSGGEIWINGAEAHHMLHVKRLRLGERVCLFDGKGREAVGKIIEALKEKARIGLEGVEAVNREAGISITLAFSAPKGKRSETLVQKCCELGVTRLIPIWCERGVVKLRPQGSPKVEKWRRVSLEASKQCGRTYITAVEEVSPFLGLLEKASSYELSLLASAGPGALSLRQALRDKPEAHNILGIVGPEGGFSEEELERASRAGCTLVSLGPRVLRTETAALALVSMLLYAYSA